MKTILIPVDFSNASINAVKYAAGFSSDNQIERIIVLKSFYVSVYAQLLPSADFVQLSADELHRERNEYEQQLNVVRSQLSQSCGCDVKIETAISELPLLRSLHQVIAQERPDVIVVGSDNPLLADESYIGAQMVAIAKSSPVPVLVVPSTATYEPIKKALVPCDFASVFRLSMLKNLKAAFSRLHIELEVLNVDPQQKHLAHEVEHEAALKQSLESYDYKVHYSDNRNIVHGILDFARRQDIQLIIALPGRHSFFHTLTRRSITEALTLNSHKPVLILK